jgi:hypothetical protein
MTDTAVYAEIVKHERDTNGDLVVFGRATGPDLDLDKQICDPDWLKSAMPTWFQTGANVREQHSSIAAGVGTEIAQLPDGGWDLKSLVVDPTSARKVEKGVLKGYSIGIRNPKVVKDAGAPGGRIVGGEIIEVSLVDRPANPTCQLTLAKALKPGPQTASAVDADRHLVKVEELHDRAAEVTEALKALDLVAVVKGDQARDIRSADQAIAIIAGLIQAEAACLADGMASEACDIDLLLSAVKALEWFKCREKKEEPMAHVEMAAAPAAEKSAAPAPTAAATPTPDASTAPGTETPPPAAEKAAEGEKTDLTELVKALQAQVTELNTQVTKAMSAPAPGGPVLTRTTEDTTKAAAREIHLAKAAEYDRLAYEVTDPQARAGYLQMAADERAAATS